VKTYLLKKRREKMKRRAFSIFFAVLVGLLVVSASSIDAKPWGKYKKQIKIIRDNYGVPHIYASDTYGLFYGFGYSIATDRLFEMEMAKRTVLGTVSEVLGLDYVAFDIRIRSNYTPASIQQQYEDLSKKQKQIFEGYANGMNARIHEVFQNKETLLPKQFTDFGFLPSKWTPFDVVMIFVGTMANRFSDFNTELDNLDFIQYLNTIYDEEKAWNIFDQTKWKNDPGAPTTVPNTNSGLIAYFRPTNAKTLLKGKEQIKKALESKRKTDVKHDRLLAELGLPALNKDALTSNFWSVGKKKTYGKGSILMNGPQFGWYNPGYVYEVGLHAPGFDVVGNSPFGYPAILFGHNRHIAWGSTAGLGDDVDIYEEQLNPGNKYQYWFMGEWRDMEKRTETIFVKDEDPLTVDVYRTVHGLVIRFDEDNGIAYSKKRTWDGYEVESLIGWIESTQARNFWQWRKAASKNALTINWYYADRRGNIGYIHTGKYPLRKENHDWRFPVSGTGDMEWLGILPFDQNPQVYNPDQGYIGNWNNKPAGYWNDPDMWWLTWGSADRVDPIFDELEAKDKFTPDEIWDMNRRLSHIDVNISYFLPFLEDAVEGLASVSREVMAVGLLKSWDRYRWDQDNDGLYDSPAQTIMQKWLPIMLEKTLRDDITDLFFWRYASAGYPTSPPGGSTNVQTGTKILYHSLLGDDSTIPNLYDFFNGEDPSDVVLEALMQALDELSNEFGTDNMSQWLLPVIPQRFATTNFNGIPQANPDEELFLPVNMNRGTENHMVVLRPAGLKGVDVCPPGQSGFVAPDGTIDPHYQDQMVLYRDFEYKDMLFYSNDVTKNAESHQTLAY
jgi:penicillin amidase